MPDVLTTKSSRVTVNKCPCFIYPNWNKISAIFNPTVVLPVPGLPVKDICRPGLFAVIPKFFLNLSINNNAAISRIRAFTGAKPTSSSSNKFKSFAISVLAYSSCKFIEFILVRVFVNNVNKVA